MEPDEAIFKDALRDENGDLESVKFSWMKKGNKKHRSWDNTVLGNISIECGRLLVEVNSVKRSKRIQSQIVSRLGDSAVVRDSITESVEQKLAEQEKLVSHEERQRRHEEQLSFQAQPEIQTQLKQMATKHWREWMNQPIPALKGKTPRQAANSVTGRERLEALFAEYQEGADDGHPFSPDIGELRIRLGLAPGSLREKAKR